MTISQRKMTRSLKRLRNPLQRRPQSQLLPSHQLLTPLNSLLPPARLRKPRTNQLRLSSRLPLVHQQEVTSQKVPET